MTDIGAFTPEDARMVLNAVRYLRANGFDMSGGKKRPANPPPGTPLYFRNDSGEEVPRYGCMQITGTVELDGQNYFTINKPADSDATAGPYLFNHHAAVADGEFGVGIAGTAVRVLGSPATAGTRLAPQAGSWEVAENESGLLVAGGSDDIGSGVVRAFLYGAGGGDTQFIRFKFPDPSSTPTKFQSCFEVHLSGHHNEPATPPLRDDCTIYFHGHAFDVESDPYGSFYHTHLWLIEYCHEGDTDDYDYLQELLAWTSSQSPFEGTASEIGCSEQDKQAEIASYMVVPGYAYDTEYFVDEDPTGCEPPEPTCPLAEKEPGTAAVAQVLSRPCGVLLVEGEDEDGNVTVVDSTGHFLGGRNSEDWLGKEGFAALVYDDQEGSSDDTSNCYWMITWIDWHEEIQLVSDVVIGTTGITISRKNVEVWRYCTLPAEVIEGTDCDATAASSSTASAAP